MQEIELKFIIPPDALTALRTQALVAGATATRLQAVYFDTPTGHLAQAKAALRLRHEGAGGWVQTFKAQGATPLHRLEHNLARGDGPVAPALALAGHLAEPTVAPALALALDRPLTAEGRLALAADPAAGGLQARFATNILRRHWRVECGPGGRSGVEFALDEGTVQAGALHQPLCELELELCQGALADLWALARDAVAQHGLWLDLRSKAERGERLRSGAHWPVVPPALRQRGARPAGLAAWQAHLGELLVALLSVGGVVASPSAAPADPLRDLVRAWHRGLGALHQGLCWAEAESLPGLDPGWSQSLALLLPPVDTADPSAWGVWQRAARSTRWQLLGLDVWAWVSASA